MIINVYYKKTTWNTNIFFSKCNSTQEVFLQYINTLQHVLLLLHGERLTNNQFLPRVLQHVFSYCSKSVCYFLSSNCNIWKCCRKHFVLNIPPIKRRQRGVISGDRGGQGVGPSLSIHLFGNAASKNQRTSEPHLVGKLSTAETLLTEVQRKVSCNKCL